jgi:hypothetical protein
MWLSADIDLPYSGHAISGSHGYATEGSSSADRLVDRRLSVYDHQLQE